MNNNYTPFTYEHFKAIFNKINGEPEYELYFKNRPATYMIIRYDDRVTFQRCGFEDGSGEIPFNNLDELYNSKTVDGVCLKDEWCDIEEILLNSTYDLYHDMDEIYRYVLKEM